MGTTNSKENLNSSSKRNHKILFRFSQLIKIIHIKNDAIIRKEGGREKLTTIKSSYSSSFLQYDHHIIISCSTFKFISFMNKFISI